MSDQEEFFKYYGIEQKDTWKEKVSNTIDVDYVLDELKNFLVPPEEDGEDDQ